MAELAAGPAAGRPRVKNEHLWRPTKFDVGANGELVVPARAGELSIGSVLVTGLVAHWYREQLPAYARGRLIDLGAGKMPLYGLYRPLVDEILCTDWDGSLHGNQFIDFPCDLTQGVPMPDACVDTVVLSDVLEHLYAPQHALREIHRILRPDGCALLNVPFMYWVHEEPHDYFRYTQFALKRMATEAGFEICRLDTVGGEFYVLADVLGKFLQRLGPPGIGFAEGIQRALLKHTGSPPISASMPLFMGMVLRRPR
jgi:SAM-dependent methyltransferase